MHQITLAKVSTRQLSTKKQRNKGNERERRVSCFSWHEYIHSSHSPALFLLSSHWAYELSVMMVVGIDVPSRSSTAVRTRLDRTVPNDQYHPSD
ncbi:hypothetical protein WG66_004285 [Moniliophthora roreri]|nr:hypothetical protein WG66_004285 [Moniliophthora roreri]